ncbi:MAG: hypothetical protein KDD11_23020 [Acidobacteria bacterium]|nr:hypothetical protein [Acidobacteriota bacterium]
MSASTTTTFPLLFSYRDLIGGKGYFAGVEVHGRALLVESDGDVWMYGMNPGGLAGGGATRKEALSDFRRGYNSVLIDIAQASDSFEGFKAEVESFFHETNDALEPDWEAAIAAVRADAVKADWLNRRPYSADAVSISVIRIEQPVAEENSVPNEELAA